MKADSTWYLFYDWDTSHRKKLLIILFFKQSQRSEQSQRWSKWEQYISLFEMRLEIIKLKWTRKSSTERNLHLIFDCLKYFLQTRPPMLFIDIPLLYNVVDPSSRQTCAWSLTFCGRYSRIFIRQWLPVESSMLAQCQFNLLILRGM